MWIHLLLSACLVWDHGLGLTPSCHDIDTNACKLLQVSRPNLCTDDALASTACPRYCNLCPLECFSCVSPYNDFTLCNSTQQCASGEVCMLKTLKSFVDNHIEYHMTCEDKQHCDGIGLTFPFGKRDIAERDITVECCSNDFCNYPTVITPTGSSQCNSSKDVIVFVDNSAASSLQDTLAVISFLFHVVGPMTIGPSDNLVGLYSYDNTVQKAFGLQEYPDSFGLKQALLQYRPNATYSQQRPDGDDAIEFLVQHVLTTADGDRPDFADAVIIIADDTTAQNLHVSLSNQRALGQLTNDVILVTVGGTTTGNEGQIATDGNHVLNVASYNNLKTNTALATSVYDLIVSCK